MKKYIISCILFLSVISAQAFEWKAQWIGAPWEGEEYVRDIVLPAPQLKKEFTVRKKIQSATAYVSGLGFFEFYVNGSKAGDEVLCPNETSYSHRQALPSYFIPVDDASWRGFRVFYLTYDITELLHKGMNEFGALLGNGFYSTGRKHWVEPYGSPRFICQVEIKYVDGTKETIVSDESWKIRKSGIVLNDMYEGEIFDARLDGRGEWQQAVVRKAPDGELKEQDGPADRVVEVLKPKSITLRSDGKYEVDFGDNVTGWVRLFNFKAPEGTEIILEYPAETDGNGIYKYICDGTRVKSYAPRFTWWVFSKVIVSGWPGKLKASNLRAEVVHSDVRENSRFACSNEMINRINEIWKRTQTDNMHLGVATDCPHREKGPYTGDGEAACVTVMHNFDARSFYRKWLHDMSDCQNTESGYVPNSAPWHPGSGGGAAWGAAMNIIPWEYYLHYGDREVLEENYLPMKEQLRHMLSWRLEDGTMYQQMTGNDGKVQYWMNLGEWCPPYNLASNNLVHTWFLWRCADYTAKAAHALGYEDESLYYRGIAEDVAAAFHKKFFNPETGSYDGGSGITSEDGYGTGSNNGAGDGANIFALAMGVPGEHKASVIASVKRELKANDNHLNTGIFGTALFFEVLCDCGLAEEAYEAMNKKDFPSYGWMLEQGSMTMWEQWNGKDSRNHPMFGGGLVWLYRRVCGVQTDENEPGYRHIIIKPTPVGDLKWALYETETSYGKLSCHWKIKKNGRFVLKLKIPAGTHATVILPDGSSPQEISSGRRVLVCGIKRANH